MLLKPKTWYWFDWYHSRMPSMDEIPAEMQEFPPPRRSGIAYVMTDENEKFARCNALGMSFRLPTANVERNQPS